MVKAKTLENSRKIHPRGVRACGPKDAKRMPQHVGGAVGEPFGSSFYLFSPPPGPALCKLGWPGALFVLPELLTPALRPSFDLPLFYFRRLFPPCLLVTAILDSCLLF